jgi:hypothetical protein
MQIFANTLRPIRPRFKAYGATRAQIERAYQNSHAMPIKKRRLQTLANTLSRKRGQKISLPRVTLLEADDAVS